MKRSDLKKKISEDIHSGWRGFVSYIMLRGENLPDGSIKIGKQYVDRWKRMAESTHYKLKPNEKRWANAIVDRIFHVTDLIRKNAIKTKTDPRVGELIKSFAEYCENIKGFKPTVNYGRDTVMIKRTLVNYSKEEILDCFDWFLNDKVSDDLSPSISTALASGVFNKFLSQR